MSKRKNSGPAGDCGNDHEHDHDHEADGCARSCVGEQAGLPRRAEFGLSPAEDMILDITRLVLSAHVAPEAGYRKAAVDYAEACFGGEPGTTLAAHVAVMVRMIRRERRHPFSFLSFGCRHITTDEEALVSLLQTISFGNDSDISDALEHLAQGGPVDGMRAAAAVLVRHLQSMAAARAWARRAATPPGTERTLH